MSTLDQQIETARLQVHTDSYPMSIGELINMYDDGDLDIHPEFQRVYRWTDTQKSKLIESILLGIPLPSIFVSQRDNGVWDVIDGVQRISTILSLLGKLKDSNGVALKPLRLQKTKYLPGLEGKVWENPHHPEDEITPEIRRIFKREKIDLKIIKRESESDTKYELFQRLNSGGTRLSDQEIRNCMLLMVNGNAYNWIKELSQNNDFIACTPLTDKQEKEAYRQELALRFVVQRHLNEDFLKDFSDVAPFLDSEIQRLFSENSAFDFQQEKDVFEQTFAALNVALEENSFKKYNHDKNRHEGAISIPVFEAMTVGVSTSLLKGTTSKQIGEKSKKLTSMQEFKDAIERKIRPLNRMATMANLGKRLFCEDKD